MKLYLVRHGQTEANLNRTHSGWGDVCLTEKGREQARRIGKILEKIDFDKIYTSDLSRAVDTGRLALPDREAELCKTVREINVGNLARRRIHTKQKDAQLQALRRRGLCRVWQAHTGISFNGRVLAL